MFWILHKIMEIYIFSQLISISALSPLVLCMYKFLKSLFCYYLSFLPARVALAANSIKRFCASGWFVRMENNNCKSNTNNYV